MYTSAKDAVASKARLPSVLSASTVTVAKRSLSRLAMKRTVNTATVLPVKTPGSRIHARRKKQRGEVCVLFKIMLALIGSVVLTFLWVSSGDKKKVGAARTVNCELCNDWCDDAGPPRAPRTSLSTTIRNAAAVAPPQGQQQCSVSRALPKLKLDWGGLLGQLPKQKSLIVEVGAADGQDAREAAGYWPTFETVSFEASPINFRRCVNSTNSKTYPNLRFVSSAVSDTIEPMVFYDSGGTGACVNCAAFRASKHAKVTVPSIRLDEYFAGRQIDLLKIDVQGFEVRVFNGLRGLLRSRSIKRILFEYDPCLMRDTGFSYANMSDILRTLHDSSFDLHDSSVSASEIRHYAKTRLSEEGLDAELLESEVRSWDCSRPTRCDEDYPRWYCPSNQDVKEPRMYTDIYATLREPRKLL